MASRRGAAAAHLVGRKENAGLLGDDRQGNGVFLLRELQEQLSPSVEVPNGARGFNSDPSAGGATVLRHATQRISAQKCNEEDAPPTSLLGKKTGTRVSLCKGGAARVDEREGGRVWLGEEMGGSDAVPLAGAAA